MIKENLLTLLFWIGRMLVRFCLCVPGGHDWFNGGETCRDCGDPRPTCPVCEGIQDWALRREGLVFERFDVLHLMHNEIKGKLCVFTKSNAEVG